MIRYVRGSETITDSSSGVSTTYTVPGVGFHVMEYFLSVAVVNSAMVLGHSLGNPWLSEQLESSKCITTITCTLEMLNYCSLIIRSSWWSWLTDYYPIKFKSVKCNLVCTCKTKWDHYKIRSHIHYKCCHHCQHHRHRNIGLLRSLIWKPGTNVNITVRAFTRIGPGEPITLINSTREAPRMCSEIS